METEDQLRDIEEKRSHSAPSLWMPVMTVEEALERRKVIRDFIDKKVLVEGEHWMGLRDAKDDRKILTKGGAEAFCLVFGFTPEYTTVHRTERWDGDEPLIAFHCKCRLYRSGEFVGEGEGSCSSYETKYRYRWLSQADWEAAGKPKHKGMREGTASEPDFAVNRGETTGKYGKPAEYWEAFREAINNGEAKKWSKDSRNGKPMTMWEIASVDYRVPNPEAPDLYNTILKMAQKRAFVAATITAVAASDVFTQDLDDFGDLPPASGQSLRQPTSSTYDDEPPPSDDAPPPPDDDPFDAPKEETPKQKAGKLYQQAVEKFGLVEGGDPPPESVKAALMGVLRIDNANDLWNDPESVVAKLEKLLQFEQPKGLEWLKHYWSKAQGEKPKAAQQPAAKPETAPKNGMPMEHFKTLNIPGMIVQITRRLGQEYAGKVRGYITTGWELERVPLKNPEIEEALKTLYSLSDAELKESFDAE